MLNPCYKGLRLVIQFVSKEITLQIGNECGHQKLLPLLIFAYNFLNPNDVGVRAPNSTSQSIETTNLCDFMETNEEMASSMVKKKLNYFRVKKGTKKEAKNPLEWWSSMHEVCMLGL